MADRQTDQPTNCLTNQPTSWPQAGKPTCEPTNQLTDQPTNLLDSCRIDQPTYWTQAGKPIETNSPRSVSWFWKGNMVD